MSVKHSPEMFHKKLNNAIAKRKETIDKRNVTRKTLENVLAQPLNLETIQIDTPEPSGSNSVTDPSLKPCITNFRCPTCVCSFSPELGFVLTKCSHRFCYPCLRDAVRDSEFSDVQCPNDCITRCGGSLTQEELRALMTPLELEQLMLKKRPTFDCKKCSQKFDTPLVALKACGHEICLDCIVTMIMSSKTGIVSCWEDDCDSLMKDEEIRSLLNTEQDHIYDQTRQKEMDRVQVVTNAEPFECSICMTSRTVGEGIVLRECLHVFCKDCLIRLVQHSTECIVKCPFVNDQLSGCDGFVQEREVRGILSEDQMQQYTQRVHVLSLNMVPNSFACRTVNCKGYWIVEPNDLTIHCNFCNLENCLKCKAIHTGLTCGQFDEVRSGTMEQSQKYIDDIIQRGDAMKCPQCNAVVMKQSGCDAILCALCRTAICWATKGRRWGPLGQNDISGGCRCRVNNKLCHPNCRNCH